MSSSSYTLKCKCGAFEATFLSDPRIVFNCHCHSCVAACKTIEDKEGFDGTSIKSDESGGAAYGHLEIQQHHHHKGRRF
jgi:hypothetical protein